MALVEQAGPALTDQLAGVEQLTVFAPTNQALDALDPSVRATFADPAELASFLAYHLVEGRTPAELLAAPPGVHPTVAGPDVQVVAAADGGPIRVNQATVITANVAASNGLINAIDQALVPPGG